MLEMAVGGNSHWPAQHSPVHMLITQDSWVDYNVNQEAQSLKAHFK